MTLLLSVRYSEIHLALASLIGHNQLSTARWTFNTAELSREILNKISLGRTQSMSVIRQVGLEFCVKSALKAS